MTRRLGWDAGAGVTVVALSAAVAWGVTRFPATTGAVPGPGIFPLALAVLWCPVGIGLIVRGRRGEAEAVSEAGAGPARSGWLFAMTVAYAIAMPLAGFVATSALYLVGAMALLGYREWWRAAALGLSIAFVVFGVFAGVMNVPLPAGWLG